MSDTKRVIENAVNEIKQERDELYLKLKLARLEANEEWLKLEGKLAKLEARAHEVGKATGEASEDIGAAAKLLAEEIRDGFRKIVKHL